MNEAAVDLGGPLFVSHSSLALVNVSNYSSRSQSRGGKETGSAIPVVDAFSSICS